MIGPSESHLSDLSFYIVQYSIIMGGFEKQFTLYVGCGKHHCWVVKAIGPVFEKRENQNFDYPLNLSDF